MNKKQEKENQRGVLPHFFRNEEEKFISRPKPCFLDFAKVGRPKNGFNPGNWISNNNSEILLELKK